MCTIKIDFYDFLIDFFGSSHTKWAIFDWFEINNCNNFCLYVTTVQKLNHKKLMTTTPITNLNFSFYCAQLSWSLSTLIVIFQSDQWATTIELGVWESNSTTDVAWKGKRNVCVWEYVSRCMGLLQCCFLVSHWN